VLGGGKSPSLTGNLLLMDRLGAHIRKVSSDLWDDWENERRALAESLRRQGRRVYEMPIGGSVPLGALGYVAAFFELLDDFKRHEINPSHIFFASSSGGTQAGLLAGKWLSGWKGTLVGLGTAKTVGELQNEISALATQTAELCGADAGTDDIVVDTAYAGSGYGIPTRECEDTILYFAQREGIFLDRVYTGKAAAGVIDYIRSKKLDTGEPIVFIHTGGNVELFA
jgi:L-cysteate sulfo-lyase